MVRPSRMTGATGCPFLRSFSISRAACFRRSATERRGAILHRTQEHPPYSAMTDFRSKSHHAQQILILHLGQVDLVSAGQQIVRQALLRLDQRIDLLLHCTRQTNLWTSTLFFWPIRKARSVAWFSTAGFHHRSKWTT